MCACFLGVTRPAAADVQTTTIPDAPAREIQPRLPAEHPPPTDDLDGTYLWLGPMGTVNHLAASWDSTVGAAITLTRVRERASLGVIGATFGGAKWAERDGGTVWLDGLIATRVLGFMVGVSAGPLVEFEELHHPRLGGSVGVWGFAGFAPFARFGVVDELGAFVEVGLHIALPVFRR